MRVQEIFRGANPAGEQAMIDASHAEWVILTCSGLGAGETLTINRRCGSSGILAASINEGTAVIPFTFTGSGGTPADRNQVKLDGCTQFTVTGTAAAVVINAIYGPSVLG